MKTLQTTETIYLVIESSKFIDSYDIIAVFKTDKGAKTFIKKCKELIKNDDKIKVGHHIITKDSKMEIYNHSISKNDKQYDIPFFDK